MTIIASIIHCQIDQEPQTFHQSDIDDETMSFAVNLSFESVSDGAEAALNDDELMAQEQTEQFLGALSTLKMAVYRCPGGLLPPLDTPFQIESLPDSIVGVVFERPMNGVPKDVINWLNEQKGVTVRTGRFWAPVAASATADEPVDVETVGAGPRLRAAQSWDAPVGHRFGLTGIVRFTRSVFSNDDNLVAVPFFADVPQPNIIDNVCLSPDNPADPKDGWRISFEYDPYGLGAVLTCRSAAIVRTTKPRTCQDFDPGLTPEGYLIVNQEADLVRRITRWFEDRAASLIAPNLALGPHDNTNEKLDIHEALFGLSIGGSEDEPHYSWDNAVWYLTSRLLASLDPFVIAILKRPEDVGEGELLAPFITLILNQLATPQKDGGPSRDDAISSSDVLQAIRLAFFKHSPLAIQTDLHARVSLALERVFDLAVPRKENARTKIAGDSDLVSELLWYFRGPIKDNETYVNPTAGQLLTKGCHTDFAKRVHSDANAEKLAAALTRCTGDLEQKLQSESDAERTIVRVLETMETPTQNESLQWFGARVPALIAKEYADLSGLKGLPQYVVDAMDSAWVQYRTLLDGPFNGAEAMRRAVGECMTKAMIADVAKDRPTAQDIVGTIRFAQCFKERFFQSAGPDSAMKQVQQSLARIDATWLAAPETVEKHLEDGYVTVVVKPLEGLLAPIRFIPDSHPQPLTIQIGYSIDGSGIDAFAKNFNGIGLAVRRLDGDEHWAHAHLADLFWGPTNVNPKVAGALHTMLPAVSDGRGPMFLEYQGFPFADPPLNDRMPENGDAPPDPRTPFYTHEPHDPKLLPRHSLTPRLAYGRNFQTFAFITSNAGTLPMDLRESAPDSPPWMPKPDFKMPKTHRGEPDATVVATVPYQRRTAIAEMSLGDDKTASIGRSLRGVRPLAADYPRAVIVAAKDGPGVCDLMRSGDGIGSIAVPSVELENQKSFAWVIDRIRWGDLPKALSLQFFDHPAKPGDQPAFQARLDVGTKQPSQLRVALRIGISPDEYFLDITLDGDAQDPQPIHAKLGEFCWLRLKLEAADGAVAMMSFAELEHGTSSMSGGPLILLRPKEDSFWNEKLRTNATVTVSTPRVSYLDFERWFANPDHRIPKDERLHSALLVAYLMRHLDKDIGRLIDSLPDPAVEAIQFEFAIADHLSSDKPYCSGGRMRLTGVLERIVTDLNSNKEIHPERWDVEMLTKHVLKPIDEAFRFKIKLAAGASGLVVPDTLRSDTVVSATSPEGTVTRLSTSTLVKRTHFIPRHNNPSVFDNGLLQYATREMDGGFVAFPSVSLRMEVVFNGIRGSKNELARLRRSETDRVRGMISARPVKGARSYDLVTDGVVPDREGSIDWRLFGEVDVTTQRWRPSGRPIYSWITPKLAAKPGSLVGLDAALELELTNAPEKNVELFEREAFFDRQDFDAHTVTQRLVPLPARTVLQKHPWDSPSATYFRHRFTLRSRYSGALLKRENREIDTWPKPKDDEVPGPGGWTHRVAMLADMSRILLTRPQLRALIPLTTAPGGDGEGRPAPPVAAILQEPPFARGGLADRVCAEIKTGFGYGFVPENPTVTILDSRKEVGPTPYLTYEALPSEAAYGMALECEGPMGLTFDNINAAAPAFPNCLISLRPTMLLDYSTPRDLNAKQQLEDLFVGVSMRRYIDPHWSIGTKLTEANKGWVKLDAEQTWWVEFTLKVGQLTEVQFGRQNKAKPQTLLSVELTQVNGQTVVEVRASVFAIDGVSHGMKTIARVTKDKGALALLHQPIAAGRFSVSIMMTPGTPAVDKGQSNVPLTLASFEWSDTREGETDDDKQKNLPLKLLIVEGSEPKAQHTIASAPTFQKWTRTGRDFDFVHAVEVDGDELRVAHESVRGLVGALRTDHKRVSILRGREGVAVWLCSSTFNSPFPLHVHRHIGFITSRYLKELGRAVEVFCRSAASGDREPTLVTLAGQVSPYADEKGDRQLYQPPEKALRVIEFETPAAIVCNRGLDTVPERFTSAYFDLLSTGFAGSEDSCIRLFLRFVGSPKQLKRLKWLNLRLWPATTPKPDPKDFWIGQIPIGPTAAGNFATGLFVTLRKSEMPNCRLDLLRSSGVREMMLEVNSQYEISGPTVARPGFFLEIDAGLDDGQEFWADVSMLHSENGHDPGPFDFDWLFSASTAANAAESVSAKGLNTMTEAQARIIAVSPPIPIVKH